MNVADFVVAICNMVFCLIASLLLYSIFFFSLCNLVFIINLND